jgi:hypothetical protein
MESDPIYGCAKLGAGLSLAWFVFTMFTMFALPNLIECGDERRVPIFYYIVSLRLILNVFLVLHNSTQTCNADSNPCFTVTEDFDAIFFDLAG